MRLMSLSNLSWNQEDENEILNFLRDKKFNSIEIAPTRKFNSWDHINDNLLKNYKKELKENFNLVVSSLQSIFFNINSNIFTDTKNFKEHFKKIINMAELLETNYIVFGSPKNRKKYNLLKEKADEIFMETFLELSEINKDIIIGIEANPRYYNCDYLINYSECKQIISLINKKNIKYHLDLGCSLLENDDINSIFEHNKADLKVIHISTKDLKSVCDDKKIIDFFKLQDCSKNCFSIEMLNQEKQTIKTNITIFKDLLHAH